jgi:hypothetical protein
VTATESPSRSASTRSTSTVICTTRNTWSTAHTPATASSSRRAGTCAAWASTASARCHWPFEVTPVLRSAGTDVVGVGAHALRRRENAEDRFGPLGGELATGLRRTCLPEHRPPLRRWRDEMAAPRTEEVALEADLTHFRWVREYASFTVVDNRVVIPGVPLPVLHPGIGRIWQSPPRLPPVGG